MKNVTLLSRKQKKTALFLTVSVVFLSYLLFAMVIPRTEVTANTTVHYSFSGILVGIQARNTGTLDITDMTMNITIIDEDGDVDYTEDVLIGTLARGDKMTHSFSFTAPMTDSYDFLLRFNFTCDGKEYIETLEYRMEDYMNFIWKDRIREWRL